MASDEAGQKWAMSKETKEIEADLEIELHLQQARALRCPATEILFGGAAGGGKLLPLDEVLPCPDGWIKMGDVKAGGLLFDENGKECRITHVFDVDPEPELYRLTFDDGSYMTACVDHEWLTFDAAELAALTRLDPAWREKRRLARKSRSKSGVMANDGRNRNRVHQYKPAPTGTVRTTAEIVATLRTKRGRANHAVPVAKPLQCCPPHQLMVDPYCLGAWLGDGTTGSGGFTGIDPEIWEEIERAGYCVTHSRTNESRHYVRGLVPGLKTIGVLRSKHVPGSYLRARDQDRLALLQGLMDTDGTVTDNGSCEFTNTNRKIAEAVHELIVGLGWKTNLIESRAMLEGRDVGPKYDLKFTPDRIVFRLARKAGKQRLASRRTTRFRYIVAAEKVPSRPGRCIEVDSPSHLYLAGRAMIPTHNSHLLRAALIAYCLAVPGLQCYLFRRTYPDLVRNHLTGPGAFPEMLAGLVTSGRCQIVRGEIRFSNGSKIHLRHLQHYQDVYSYQGAEFHVLAFDEGTHFKKEEYTYLRGRCRLGGLEVPDGCEWTFPRILIGSNPGNIGHVWVKSAFVDPGPYRIHRAPREEGGMLRCFIPSRIEDNPTLMKNDPDYVERLEGLGDPALVRALKEGDWDVVAGAMFADVWRKSLHECDPFPIPQDWDLWVGADDGFLPDPAAFVWITQDPSLGTYYCVTEWMETGKYPNQVAAETKETQSEIERASRFRGGPVEHDRGKVEGIMDSAAFGQHGQAEISRGDQMKRLGLRIEPCDKWPGSRKDRAQNLHRLLAPNPKDPQGRPGIMFFRGRCPELVKAIPTLPRDEKKPEQVGSCAQDHIYDALTYGLQYRQRRVKRIRVGGM